MPTTAPRNGMNIGALAGTPSRLSWMTWPISCANSRSTKPTANCQPQISAYAPMETSIEPLVVSSLSFGSTRRRPFSLPARLTSSASAPAMAPPARLRGDCAGFSGGGAGGGSYAGARGVSKSMLICHRIVTEGADP
jgi:hypothetical protein